MHSRRNISLSRSRLTKTSPLLPSCLRKYGTVVGTDGLSVCKTYRFEATTEAFSMIGEFSLIDTPLLIRSDLLCSRTIAESGGDHRSIQ